MKQLYFPFYGSILLGGLLWVTTTAFMNAPAGLKPVGNGHYEESIALFEADTTIVGCENATTDYNTWVNTNSFRIQLSEVQIGESLVVEPQPFNNYTFSGPCGDTLAYSFNVVDANNMVRYSEQLVFIAADTLAPQFSSTLEDTIRLSCKEDIPDASTVQVTENCDPNPKINFTVRNFSSKNCPLRDTIIRRWEAEDACGNISTYQQTIIISDDEPPQFSTLPPDTILLDCGTDISPASLGEPTVEDNCDASPSLQFFDQTEQESCTNRKTISRLWLATDECSNTNSFVQVIIIDDREAPTFSVPKDTTVGCESGDNPLVTGMPTNLADNCDALTGKNIRFEDKIIADVCENNYTVVRTWFVFDACGNTDSALQRINVVDESAPLFSRNAQDLILNCTDDREASDRYEEWLLNRGGAVAADNCSPDNELQWQVLVAGTALPAVFPARSCRDGDQFIYQQQVDFVVIDQCGNRDTTTAQFAVVDNKKPKLSNCPAGTIINTGTADCNGSILLAPPQIEEDCAAGTTIYERTIIDTLKTDAPPGQEGDRAVLPIEARFEVEHPAPINAAGPVNLRVSLRNADAEAAREYFNVVGEDGSQIGITALTPVACGDSDVDLTITAAQFNKWARDGVITIRLEPNLPRSENLAINAVCAPFSTVELTIRAQLKSFENLSFAYRVNQADLITTTRVQEIPVSLSAGSNQITYLVTDCAGNVDSCTFTVTVQDVVPPVVSCPDDLEVVLDQGTCTANVMLPLPASVVDNCDNIPTYDRTLPLDTATALFTFGNNTDIGDFLAEEKKYIFEQVAANALEPVELIIYYRGDFSSPNARMQILGESGSELAQTNVGSASCDREGRLSVLIPRDTFNRWAVDGRLEIGLKPLNKPSGSPGDGINPCGDNVTQDGQVDNVSYVFARLRYNGFLPEYSSTGATMLPLSQMSGPVVRPTHTFALGTSTIRYSIQDPAGNTDSCSFRIIVKDEELPTARCQPTTLFINPSGLEQETIGLSEIDAGSSDNCSIDTMFLTPAIFTCETQTGNIENVTLTVRDIAGNESTCTTFVRLENLLPEPTANSGLCGNDTLFLSANPPAAAGGIVYTYRWTGPNGFTSNRENPVIPNISPINAGSYTVEVTGLTGCVASGTVEVSIEGLPLTPEVIAEPNYCVGDFITLRSSVEPDGARVEYRWYRGVPPNGTLIGETIVPSFSLQAAAAAGTADYYVEVEADGCISRPSVPFRITVNEFPRAVLQDTAITVCAGESITLGTPVIGPGITYEWTGPNGFRSAVQFPEVIESATALNDGIYSLVVLRNGCASNPAFIRVNVLPRPNRPMLSNSGPICEGEMLALSTNAQASVYRWISPDLTEFSTTTNRFEVNNAGQSIEGPWQLYVTAFGCDSETSEPSMVVVNDLPNTAASASPDIVCSGTTVTLNASPNIANATYRWTGPNAFVAVGRTVTVENMRSTKSGRYQVVITTESGCSKSDFIDITVRESIRIIAVSNNGTPCLSGPTDIKLTAAVFPEDNGNFSYRWTGPNGFVSTMKEAVIPNATSANNGNYQLVVTNGEGCISEPANTIVDVSDPPKTPAIPTVSMLTPPPYCVGAPLTLLAEDYTGTTVTYNWVTPNAGIQVTTEPFLSIDQTRLEDAGNYALFVTVDGCNSKTSNPIRIQVGERPEVTVSSNSPVCEGEAIRLQAGFVAGGSYFWSGPEFSSSLQNPTISNVDSAKQNGIYVLVVERNGCTSEPAAVEVQVNPSPARPQLIAGDRSVCGDVDTAYLRLDLDSNSITSNARYIWSAGGNPIDTTNTPFVELRDFSSFPDGVLNFTARGLLQSCPSPESEAITLTVNRIPENVAFAGQDFSVCETSNVSLRGEAPAVGVGRWTLVEPVNDTTVVIVNPLTPITAIDGLEGGKIYRFRWSLSNGACINYSIDDVEVNTNRLEAASAGEDQIACASDTVRLNAKKIVGGTGFWSQPETQSLFGVRIMDPMNPQTVITGMVPGNLYSFIWNVQGSCGNQSDEVLVLLSDPNPFAGPDQVVCNDEGFTELSAEPPTDGSVGLWKPLTPGVQISVDQSAKTAATNLQEGENIFVWELDNGSCGPASRDSVRVFFKRNPSAQADEYQAGFGQEIQFDVLLNDSYPIESTVTIVQEPKNGTIVDQEFGTLTYRPNVNFVGTDRILYEICSEACECALGEVTIKVDLDSDCAVPSVISPNGDGVNDVFSIPCLLDQVVYPNSQLIIFNRWGDEVFRSGIPYDNNWDGTYNGEDLPVGTYFYILDFGTGQPPVNSFFMIQR